MRRVALIITIITLSFLEISAQETLREITYKTSIEGFAATKDVLPFWSVTNRYGITPESNGGLVNLGVFSDFSGNHRFKLAYGISASGYVSNEDNKLQLDQIYMSGMWRRLRLDLGMIHRKIEFGGISASNGNIVYSNNSRSQPGYNLSSDYITLPLGEDVLSFRFNWSDYMMIDDRYVEHALLHNKSLFLKIKPANKWEIILGLEHFAEWAGDSPRYGKQPSSLMDYARIFLSQSGGDGATPSDSINSLGNHLGREHLQVNYLHNDFTLTFYHDRPFEDGSGLGLRNIPDGIYGIYYGSKNVEQWLSDVIYEFFYTKYQSGRYHDINGKIKGGIDNYFNNGEYRSAWTYYGRTIGLPLITPVAPNDKGITLGVFNNRLIAHHVGIKGYAFRRLPYKFMCTYSLNYGTYSDPLNNAPLEQISLALEICAPKIKNLPFDMEFGMYADFGEMLTNNVGFSLKFYKNGSLR
ncbi:MAG: capsule assembly Wzi family protein [Culturomica sp.]|jgi:hypothetical protein|nr:capsule assembly Wzi family protein [Culturomica sp.]